MESIAVGDGPVGSDYQKEEYCVMKRLEEHSTGVFTCSIALDVSS